MNLRLDTEQIEKLMRSFHTLTGIRFVLFDASRRELISYPRENCDFCKLMKSCAKTRRKCAYADRRACEKCEQAQAPVVYTCHAGLYEAVIPLQDNERIIGYLMFGQIADAAERETLYPRLSALSERYEIDADSKIMEACTSFIIYKELITPENNRIIEAAKGYIEEHLDGEIDPASLCETLEVGRTRLYELFRAETGMGIAAYVRRRRMHRAKKLLKNTTLSIGEIAHTVGFTDYNYFSRVYKKTYGKSPKRYR